MATPQQNGIVKRKHKHLLETGQALLFQAKLPLKYLGESILTATYIVNRLPSVVLSFKFPYELLYHYPPSYDHIDSWVFVFHFYPSRNRTKFMSRAVLCVFLGYSYSKKTYKVLNLLSHYMFESKDVTFHESIFPFHLILDTSSFVLLPTMFPDVLFSPTFVSSHLSSQSSGSPPSSPVTHFSSPTSPSQNSPLSYFLSP